VDGSYDETERAARANCEVTAEAAFLSSYNDPGVIAGQATIGLELLEQWPDVEAVVVPVGGGGLISGVGLVTKHLAPWVRVVGVEPAASCAMSRSVQAGQVTPISDGADSVAECLVGNLDANTITLPLVERHVDEFVLVEEEEIRSAVRRLYWTAGLVAEPSGAVAIAALERSATLRSTERVACLITGRNVAPSEHLAMVAPDRLA
jgi:threonine dehydratase